MNRILRGGAAAILATSAIVPLGLTAAQAQTINPDHTTGVRKHHPNSNHRLEAGSTTFQDSTPCSSASSWTVPDNVSEVRMTAHGGHGGEGFSNGSTSPGGNGGNSIGTFAVTPGQKLYVQVAGNGSDTSTPNAGAGAQGGGAGGPSQPFSANTSVGAGGGGGASGVSLTPDCTNWLVVGAGGGGAGAGLYIRSNTTMGGHGGDAASPGSSSAPATAGQSTYNSYCVGKPGASAPNASGGDSYDTLSNGTGNKRPQGMVGGTGGDATPHNQGTRTVDVRGAGGGGGGGGYVGGAGGGAALDKDNELCAGGGGAGGTNYVNAAALPGSTTMSADDGNPEVVIQPVGYNSHPIVLQSADNGQALNISGGDASDGAHLVQWPRGEGWNEQWQLQAVGNDYHIINPHSGKCLAVTNDMDRQYPIVGLATCANGVVNAQDWFVQWLNDGTLRISNADRVLSITGNSPGADIVVAPYGNGEGNDWANRWSAISPGWPAGH